MVLIHSGFVWDGGSARGHVVLPSTELRRCCQSVLMQWESLVDEFNSSKRTWRLEFTLLLRCLWFRRH